MSNIKSKNPAWNSFQSFSEGFSVAIWDNCRSFCGGKMGDSNPWQNQKPEIIDNISKIGVALLGIRTDLSIPWRELYYRVSKTDTTNPMRVQVDGDIINDDQQQSGIFCNGSVQSDNSTVSGDLDAQPGERPVG